CSRGGESSAPTRTAAKRSTPVIVQIAVRKPWSSASPLAALTAGWPLAKELVDEAAIALIAARPIAPPIWRLVFTRPDAMPASERSTPVRLAIVTGTNDNP